MYDGAPFASSAHRGGTLAYPEDWGSYHCALSDADHPAVMDDFWQSPDGPEKCQHDTLTRVFLLDPPSCKSREVRIGDLYQKLFSAISTG